MSAIAFIVSPETLIFRNSNEKESDSLDISVRNISKKPIRVRFSLPQTSLFMLSSGQTFLIPPGLTSSVKITHQSKSNIIERSSLTVYSPDESVNIPIISYPPSPNVQYNEKSINIGTMSYLSVSVRKFSFTNYGTLEGFFKIKCDNNFIEISPKTGIIKANEKIDSSFTFNPPAPGSYSFHITLSVDKNIEDIPPLLVTAEVVDQSISLQYEKQDLDCLDFGPLFYGSKRSLTIQIVNKSSSKRNFTIQKPFAEKFDNSIGTSAASLSPKSFFRTSSVTYDQRQSVEMKDNLFTISPMNGELKPKSSTNITVTFSPPQKSVIDDIETIYSSLSEVCIADTDIILPFKMTGSGFRIGFLISCIDFDFGQQKVKTKSIKMLSIQNESKVLPIQFKIKQIAHFHFFPSSGSISPNGVRDIQVIFQPNSLGLFNITADITFCQDMISRKINLSGESVAELKEINKEFKYPNITEFPGPNDNVKPEYSLNVNEAKDKYEKRKIFDSYLTDMEKKREEYEKEKQVKMKARQEAVEILNNSNQKYDKNDLHEMILNQIKKNIEQVEDPVSLGFKPHEGLTPPNPPLRIKEPMKLPSETFRVRNTKKKPVFNDKVTIEKKFKQKPTKKNEINECSKKLQTTQLLHVIPSSQLVNFGSVSVFSKEVRSFQITNNNQMHILVEIVPFAKIKNSYPKSQVIPPNHTAGFDIILDTSKSCHINNKFNYIINGNHTYSINVIANVNPIDVVMNSSILSFKLPSDSFQNFSCQNLVLFNNSNSVAKFEINGFENSVFSFHDKSGSIQPNSNFSIEVTYKPDTNPHSERIVNISVLGGNPLSLRLVGDTGNPNFSLNRKSVDYGLISLGVKTIENIEIINDSDDAGVFSITPSFTDILSINPPKGRINKHSSIQLTIEVTCEKPGKFDIPIKVTICGSNPISFNVSGHAEIPHVEVSHDILDFGKMFLGTVTSKQISIKNTGVIPAVLYLNMSDIKMFNIKYSTPFIKEIQEIQVKQNESKSNESQLTIMNDESIAFSGFKYKIEIAPQKNAEFELVYHASKSGRVSFYLPLVLENVSNEGQVKQPFITAEAVKTPLFISSLEVCFGPVPLHDPLNPNNKPKTQALILRNDSPSRIKYRFEIESSIFQLHQYSGIIEYACSSTIFVHFKPVNAIPYSYSMPLYVISDNGETRIAEIQLTGIGSNILFTTSTKYLALPIVPLGVKTHSEMNILNVGCIPIELEAKIAVNEKQFPLEISFPKGKKMNFNTISIPIKVAFVSSKPISFSTMVLLVDKNGNSAAFTVSVTTDNSIFTLYSFLSYRDYAFESDSGKPIMIQAKNENLSLDFLSSFLSASDFINFEPKQSKFISNNFIQFLIQFLNNCILTNPIRNFPMDFIEKGNQIISEIITNLTGKKQNNQMVTFSSRGNNTSSEKYKQSQKLIHYLMSQGALLSTVKPEFLLSQTDFTEIMKEKITKHLLGLDFYGAQEITSFKKKDIEAFTSTQIFNSNLIQRLNVAVSLFRQISLESWTIIILQIIKLFMFGKLMNSEAFMQLPGVKESLNEIHSITSENDYNEINRSVSGLSNSNIFTAAECLLLKWASIHYCKIKKCSVPALNNFNQFKDPRIFLSIFASHLPQNEINFESGFNEVLKLLKNSQINFVDNEQQLEESNPIIYALILQQLMEYLPHYLPSSKIVLKAPLNKVTKYVMSVTNPSTSHLYYIVDLKSSETFTLNEKSFELGPHKSHDVIVEYFPKMHNPEKALLTLIPSHQTQQKEEIHKNKPTFVFNQSNENEQYFTPKPPSKERKQDAKKNEDPRRSLRRNIRSNKRNQSPETTSPSFSSVPNIAAASTVVVEITTQITYSAPYKTDYIEGTVYGSSKLEVSISNIIKQKGHFQLYYKIFEMNEGEEDIKTLSAQMKKFMDNPEENAIVEGENDYENIILNYSAFIFDHREIEFKTNSEKEEAKFEVEFVPISLKSYRCLILFRNNELGEIIYEIIGRTKIPDRFTQSFTCKAESKKSCSYSIPINMKNPALFKAIAYTQTKLETSGIFVSEKKFNDIIEKHSCEISSAYSRNLKPIDFNVILSSEYFKILSNQFKLIVPQAKGDYKENQLSLLFNPTDAGEFPCRVVLQSQYDVRVYLVTGIGTHETNYASIDFDSVAFRPYKQVIPIQNKSDLNWFYKCTFSGFSGFSGPSHFIVHAKSTYNYNLSFYPNEVGSFEGQVIMNNNTKEFETVYSLKGNAREPPAAHKYKYEIKAREQSTEKVPIPYFSKTSGLLNITTDVPVISLHNATVELTEDARENMISSSISHQLINSSQGNLFEDENDLHYNQDVYFDLFALRSGVTAGILTFTDTNTGAYQWYMIEVTVSLPDPEETINVSTPTRSPIDINIPVVNHRNYPITFSVEFNDDELSGPSQVTIPAESQLIYVLHLNPLKASNRVTAVSFYHDTEGEYLYNINISIQPSEIVNIAPLSAYVGSNKSEIVTLENPLNLQAVFKVENDNQTNFRVITPGNNPIITIPPQTKMMIEVRFIPTSISIKTFANITFSSRLLGDFSYRFSGYGKAPIPSNPIRIKSMIQVQSSGQIKFLNPFPSLSKFEIVLQTESNFFSILSKRKVFTLTEYQEEFQIIFSFYPKIESQNNDINSTTFLKSLNQIPNEYKATILVSTVGREPTIHWTYPIIANIVQGLEKHNCVLKGKANKTIFHKIIVNLNNEKFALDESNFSDNTSILSSLSNFSSISASKPKVKNKYKTRNLSDYFISLKVPDELAWMKKYISILPLEIIDGFYIPYNENDDNNAESFNDNSNKNRVCVVLKVLLRRPVDATSIGVIVEKPSTNQKWRSDFDIHIEQDFEIHRIISLESSINDSTSHKIKINEPVRMRTEFSAYFLPNSSHDMSVAPSKAIIEPSLLDEIELPFVVTYHPKTYGKMMKGTLIIESDELQLLFEIHGRMPKYVPPKTRKSGKIDTSTPEGAKPIRKSTRNFIKENIECIRAYQKNGQMKLKMNSSYDSNKLKKNDLHDSNSNLRNRTKVTRLPQNNM